MMEGQLNEEQVSKPMEDKSLQMKLICKFIEFSIINQTVLDFEELEKVFVENSKINMLFQVLSLRKQIFRKNLNSLEVHSSDPSKLNCLIEEIEEVVPLKKDKRNNFSKEKSIKFVDLSFLEKENDLIKEKIEIIKTLKEVLGEHYDETMLYGDLVSKKHSKSKIKLTVS